MYRFIFTVTSFFLPLLVQSHHSRAPFMLDDTFETKGIVTEVAWQSPHVYLVVDTITENGTKETWTFEGHSIAGLVGNGWEKNSIKVDDEVIMVANPNRNPEKKFGLIDNVTRPDGATFYSFRVPSGAASNRPNRAPSEPSTDFSGTWSRVSTLQQALVGGFGVTDWPVTAKGQAQLAEYDLRNDPQLDCVPVGIPALIFYPYSTKWTRENDKIFWEKDQYPINRTIHLDGPPRPSSHKPDALGYSIGKFEPDGTLVVETTGFAPTAWGATRGLDSSEQKRVTERYRLTEDGFGMQVSYTIEDPVYLAEPATQEGSYRKVLDHEFSNVPCDPETARRHLTFE